MIRSFENEKKKEPYQRLSDKLYLLMQTHQFDNDEMLKVLIEELTFEKFLIMKEKWLRTLRTEWLIMGHLD